MNKMQEDVLRKIGTIARSFDSIANIEFKEMQLTRGQYLYLVRIDENPGIISERLAEILNIDRTTTARSVQKLVKNDLVVKRSDSNNKKNKKLFLTEKGQNLVKIIERENKYSNETSLEGLTTDEKDTLLRLLTKVAENASESWKFVKNGGRREY
ncbi:transcriptional regulator [Lactobacillus kalixensis DSM 16043]|uniref:Transcriptional regulator n=2 Tax=Lactobacillus kalixensis TaxID=227944 RepID=A0A0R1UCC8_9LACO|nr:transcriptional regulator [Lactobacillus kalixensis DSM 16043]